MKKLFQILSSIILIFCLACEDQKQLKYYYSVNEVLEKVNDGELISTEYAPTYFDVTGYISKIDDTYSSIEIHDENETTTLLCSCQSEKCIEQLHDYKVNRKVWLTGRLIEDDKQVVFIITEIAT